MYHLVNNYTDKSGNALAGYYVKLKVPGGAYATLYGDESGTPIISTSGVADAAVTDANGVFDAYVADGTYDIEFFDKNDINVRLGSVSAVPMFAEQTVDAIAYESRTVKTKLDDWCTPLDKGAAGDGTTDDSAAIDAAIATGKHVVFPKGSTFLTSASSGMGHRPASDGQIFEVNGTINHDGSVVALPGGHAPGYHGIFFIDQFERIAIVGRGVINGARDSFATSENGRGIYAIRAPGLMVDGIRFEEFIQEALKLVNCPETDVRRGFHAYRTRNNGIEVKSYAINPYTGAAWVGTVYGPSGKVDGTFEDIDDGLRGTGNGCGVLYAAESGALPIKGLDVSGRYLDCGSAIWSENNFAGSEAQDIRILAPYIEGNIRGAGTNECWDGIGLIGVRGGLVRDAVLRNQVNVPPLDPVTQECVGLNLVDCEDVLVENLRVFNSTGITAGSRMQHAIKIYGCDRVTVRGGSQTNCRDTPILKVATNTSLKINGFDGGTGDEDWGDTFTLTFALQNVPSSATTALLANGQTALEKFVLNRDARLVGAAVRASAAATGTFTIITKVAGASQTPLNITQADLGGTVIAHKERSAASAPQYSIGDQVEAEITTDATGFPNTNDLVLVLTFASYSANL